MPGKVQKGDFLKKPSRKYILFCFVLSWYESLEGLKR
jgi:hypothetical protein